MIKHSRAMRDNRAIKRDTFNRIFIQSSIVARLELSGASIAVRQRDSMLDHALLPHDLS